MKRKEPKNANPVNGMEDANKFLEDALRRKKFYSTIVQHISSVKQNGRFLEIGSGPCVLTEMLAKQLPEVQFLAIDISPEINKIAQEYIIANNVRDRINIIYGSAEDNQLLINFGKFDLIYSTFAMHHWPDAKKIINQLYNRLNPEGNLIIYDFIRVWWLYYLPVQSAFFPCLRSSFRIKEIKKILSDLNLHKYEITRKYLFFQRIEIKKSN